MTLIGVLKIIAGLATIATGLISLVNPGPSMASPG